MAHTFTENGNIYFPGPFPIDVRGFGASGDGSDATAGMIKAIAAAAALAVGSGESGGFASNIQPSIFLPKGKYRLTAPIALGNVWMMGDQAQLYYADNDSFNNANSPLVTLNGYRGYVSGIVFGGGKNHISVIGPATDAMFTVVENCDFNNCSDVSILVEPGYSMHFVLQRFRAGTSPVIRGGADQWTIGEGWVTWDQTKGHCFDVGGNAKFHDILGVPTGAQTVAHAWVHSPSSDHSFDGVRFGGEGGGGTAVIVDANPGDATARGTVSMTNCYVFATGIPWLVCNGNMPSVHLRRCVGSADGISLSAATMTDLAAGIDPSVLLVEADKLSQISLLPRIRGPAGSMLESAQLAQFLQAPHEPVAVGAQSNLFTAGVYHLNQSGLSQNTSVGITYPANDTTTGYTLPQFTSGQADAQFDEFTTSWGAGVPAGVYCFSVYAQCSKPARLILQLDHKPLREMAIGNDGGAMQRCHAAFYHDGASGHQIGIAVQNIPNGATGTIGLFMINAGVRPAPYIMPGNAQTQNWTPTFHYLATAASAPAGPNKVGDQIIHTDATSGNYVGRVCTAAGSPGTWKTFGAIS